MFEFETEEQNDLNPQDEAAEEMSAEAEVEEETFAVEAEVDEVFEAGEVSDEVDTESDEAFEKEEVSDEVEAETDEAFEAGEVLDEVDTETDEAFETEEASDQVEAEETEEAEKTGEKIEGTVKWFSNPKGYGFISREGGEDVFVHYSAIEGSGFRSLSAGERVEFVVKASDKGPRAAEVRSLEQDVGAGWL